MYDTNPDTGLRWTFFDIEARKLIGVGDLVYRMLPQPYPRSKLYPEVDESLVGLVTDYRSWERHRREQAEWDSDPDPPGKPFYVQFGQPNLPDWPKQHPQTLEWNVLAESGWFKREDLYRIKS